MSMNKLLKIELEKLRLEKLQLEKNKKNMYEEEASKQALKQMQKEKKQKAEEIKKIKKQIKEDINMYSGGLVTKKYVNPVTIVDNRKKRK